MLITEFSKQPLAHARRNGSAQDKPRRFPARVTSRALAATEAVEIVEQYRQTI